MKRKFLLFIALSMGILALIAPPAHASFARPHHTSSGQYCFADSCDGTLPHGTDGGSNCLSNYGLRATQNVVDKDGRTEGQVKVFESYACHTYWASLYTTTTYMTKMVVETLRDGSNSSDTDDPSNSSSTYTYPNYSHNVFLDEGMQGFDGDSIDLTYNDCFDGTFGVWDRYNTYHFYDLGSFCSV